VVGVVGSQEFPMPINERPHGVRIRRKAAAVNAFTPKPAASQPEPEPEPELGPARRTQDTSVGKCAHVCLSARAGRC
jgi:hypothetical protein